MFNTLADQWLDQTINTFHAYNAPAATTIQPVKVEQTAQLLREFNSVYDAVELTHLTPPQTPPESPPDTPPIEILHNEKQVSYKHPYIIRI